MFTPVPLSHRDKLLESMWNLLQRKIVRAFEGCPEITLKNATESQLNAFTVVKHSTTPSSCVKAAGDSDIVVGVTQQVTQAGQMASVRHTGPTKVLCDASPTPTEGAALYASSGTPGNATVSGGTGRHFGVIADVSSLATDGTVLAIINCPNFP